MIFSNQIQSNYVFKIPNLIGYKEINCTEIGSYHLEGIENKI